MIVNWKKISSISMLFTAGFLLACNNNTAESVVTSENQDKIEIDIKTVEARKSFDIAALDQSIPAEKKEVEGLPKISGLDSGKTAVELAKDISIILKNPYTGDPEKIKEGKRKWFAFGCSGCHGGGGGGGMCPSVINEKWVYSGKDNILFRLATLGSLQLMEQGHVRVKTESVVAPMPQVGEMTNMTTEDIWLVLTYMRSKFKGRDIKIEW